VAGSGTLVGFKTVKGPQRKIICARCEQPTDVFLGVSILAEGRCQRCGRKRAGLVVQEPAQRAKKV
jgi:hypothetical protein